MKIGLIGNMNNNNFALMRYFRDLGADAHLLLYTNDGKGSLSHFRPEADTWDIGKWAPYIHQTDIPNAPIAAFEIPYSWLLSLSSLIKSTLGQHNQNVPSVSKGQICHAYSGYDHLVASGISPATLYRTGIPLDIFYPYSCGVEFLRTEEFVVRFAGRFGLNRFIFNRVAQYQIEGIRLAKKVFNAEMGITHDVLCDIGVAPLKLAIPMVYGQEQFSKEPPTKALRDILLAISNSEFTVLHHSRLKWKNPGHYSKDAWVNENKNNDWLLRAFAELVKNRPSIKAQLLIVEYGPDIVATKQLATKLAIDCYITWLPKMERRELMWLLSRISVGVGEFYNVPRMIWGGTGWETLASAKPLLQGFNFKEDEFEQIFGYPPPPMLPVRKQDDILQHLLDMADQPQKLTKIGQAAKVWFNQYNGIGLAKQWLELLKAPKKTEDDSAILSPVKALHD